MSRARNAERNLVLEHFVQAAADCPDTGRVFLSRDRAEIVADAVVRWQNYARRKVIEDRRLRAKRKAALAAHTAQPRYFPSK